MMTEGFLNDGPNLCGQCGKVTAALVVTNTGSPDTGTEGKLDLNHLQQSLSLPAVLN